MRTIHIFLLGVFDHEGIEKIKRLDFGSSQGRPVAAHGVAFVDLKVRSKGDTGAWLTVRGEDEALLKFLRDFEDGYEPSVDYLNELELTPELQEKIAIADEEGLIQ
jgi:hypothetical protein